MDTRAILLLIDENTIFRANDARSSNCRLKTGNLHAGVRPGRCMLFFTNKKLFFFTAKETERWRISISREGEREGVRGDNRLPFGYNFFFFQYELKTIILLHVLHTEQCTVVKYWSLLSLNGDFFFFLIHQFEWCYVHCSHLTLLTTPPVYKYSYIHARVYSIRSVLN